MTDDAVKRALQGAVREAFRLGQQPSKLPVHKVLALAMEYAESLVLPFVDARVEQALEDGYTSAVETRQQLAVGP